MIMMGAYGGSWIWTMNGSKGGRASSDANGSTVLYGGGWPAD